jgi:two-component system, sensor histidine kinase and response regulator
MEVGGSVEIRIETILAVVPDRRIRKEVTAQLVAAGFAVSAASSTETALEMLAGGCPDLLLLFAGAADRDEAATCERFREAAGGAVMPIATLAGAGDLALHESVLRGGADDLIRWPLGRPELVLRIRSLLRLKRLEHQLEAGHELIRSQRDALVTVKQQREELVALMVHDMNNPLTSIMMCAHYLLRTGGFAAEKRRTVEDIRRAADSMHRMVTNLLDINRGVEGALSPNMSRVDLGALLDQTLAAAKRRVAERGQTLSIVAAPGACMLEADPDLLRRLCENLLDNAIKFSPEGGTIRVETRAIDDRWLELRVADDGPGIPEPDRERIFEKYVRLGAQPRTARTSRGLGLTSCRLAVELHGGRIWVEDNQPSGSVFCASLPIEHEMRAHGAAAAKSAPRTR